MSDVDFFEEDTGTGSARFKSEVTNNAIEHRKLESQIAELKDKIKLLEGRKNEIEQKILPDIMRIAGVKSFTTAEGLKIETKLVVGSIPAEKKDEAYAWMDANGHSDIIKRNLTLQFAKGDTQKAEAARQAMHDMGFDPTLKLDIHAQTFMAFARETLKTGVFLPLEQWGVWYGEKATIK